MKKNDISIVSNLFVDLFESRGFKKKKNSFSLCRGMFCFIVDFQKSVYNSESSFQYTVNVAVHVLPISKTFGADITVWNGQWMARISHFLNQNNDIWYSCINGEVLKADKDSICDVFEKSVFPFFCSLVTPHDFLQLLKQGKSQGLTMKQIEYVTNELATKYCN